MWSSLMSLITESSVQDDHHDINKIFDIQRLGLATFFLALAYFFYFISSLFKLEKINSFVVDKWSSLRLLHIFIFITLAVRFISFGLLAGFGMIKNADLWYPFVVILFTLPEVLVLSTYVMLFFHWLETYIFSHDQFLVTNKAKFGMNWRWAMIVCNVLLYGALGVAYTIMILKPQLLQDAVVTVIEIVVAWCCIIFPMIAFIVLMFVGCIVLSGFPFESAVAKERATKMNWVFAVWSIGRLVRGVLLLVSISELWQQNLDQFHLVIVTVATLALAEFFPFVFALEWSVISTMLLGQEAQNLRAAQEDDGMLYAPSHMRESTLSAAGGDNPQQWDISMDQLEWSSTTGTDDGVMFSHFGSFLGRKCMVKGFRLPQMNTDMLTELTDELIVCSALYHPHIIQFLGVAQNEGCIYAVVEKAKLGSLQNELLRQADGDTGFYEKSELYEDHTHLVLSVAHQIAKAMLFLHSFDQVHASLSSANVVFGNDYTVKVTDVGIRKLKAFAEVSAVQRFSTAWSAPEVLQGQPAGKASDVYAFGMICYELLTKKIPFESLELKEIRKQVCKLHRRPVLPSRGLPDVPKAFINMIKECWMTDPKDRPSFQEIIELLQDPMTVHLDLQELQDEYKQ